MIQFKEKEQENEKLRQYAERIQKEIEDTYRGKIVSFDFGYNTNNHKGHIIIVDKDGKKYDSDYRSIFPIARHKPFRSWAKTESKIHAICSKKMNPIINKMENTDKYWFIDIQADYEKDVAVFTYRGTRGNL